MKNSTLTTLIILFLFSPLLVKAQDLYEGDQRFIHFGFSLGMATADFGIRESTVELNNKTYLVDVSTLKQGFAVGIIGDMAMWRYLNLRFTPTLYFIERELSYKPVGGTQGDILRTTTSSIPVSIPLYIKYSAERYKSVRPYLLAGGNFCIDMAKDNERPVMLNSMDVYAEVGIGCDIYFSFFKLAPELKLAIGGTNVFKPLDRRDADSLSEAERLYSIALSRLTSRLLTITFNFE